MHALETDDEPGRDAPVRGAIAQPVAHRAEDLQRLGHAKVGADTDLERIRLPRRNGGGAVEEREYRERLGYQIGRADTPAEGVVEARARRRAYECGGQGRQPTER